MPLLQKEIIAPDEYHTPEGVVRATPARIRHWFRQGQRMLAKRLQIPLPWEHQDGAKPKRPEERLADQARNNTGFLRRYFLDRDGRLWGLLDIPDPKTAEHVARDVKYVSPEIDPEFTDGDGQVWHDVITHLAITPRPVAHRQSPFGTRPRLSHNCIHLSLCQRKGVDMSEYDDDREQYDDGDEYNAEEGGAPDDAALLEEIKGLLSQKMGLDLPEHTTPDSFKRDLCVALHAHPGHGNRLGEDEVDEGSAARDCERGAYQREGARGLMLSRRRRAAARQLSHGRHPRDIGAARGHQVATEILRNAGIKPRW
jgi:hypothetical protein